MTDLKDRLRDIERLRQPDLWDEVQRRAAVETAAPITEPSRGVSTGRRVRAGLVAAIIVVIAASFAWVTIRSATRPATPPTVTPNSGVLPEGWTRLPDPPEVRDGAAMVWAGDRLLLWGGVVPDSTRDAANGFSFDPATRTWTEIPAAPTTRQDTIGVWTGTQAMFLGGSVFGVKMDDGAAFDPASGAWRSIPSAPVDITGGVRPAVVWTGSELIVWGGSADGPRSVQGAAFDPSTWTWQRIADAPIGMNLANAAWTGQRMMVVGSLLSSGNVSATHSAIAEAYDPAADAWRRLPDPPISPQATAGGWLQDRFIAYDYGAKAATFDPVSDAWAMTPKMSFAASECYPDGSVVSPTQFLAWFCGDASLYDLSTGTWSAVDGGATTATVQANGRPYPLWETASITSGDGAVYLNLQGITVDNSGAPCYGCVGSPRSYWAYRPPAS